MLTNWQRQKDHGFLGLTETGSGGGGTQEEGIAKKQEEIWGAMNMLITLMG